MDDRVRVRADIHGATDRGLVRAKNEDQFLIASLDKSIGLRQTSLADSQHRRLFAGSNAYLLAVADGLGGHQAGEKASALAVESLCNYVLGTIAWCYRLDPTHDEDYAHDLKAALHECHAHIQDHVKQHPELEGMGTTLVLAYVLWPKAFVVHAGDSRCYLIRDAHVIRLTTDQTIAQQLVDAGFLDAGEADNHRLSHVLTSAVGGRGATVEPLARKLYLRSGDALLLCSDGLTRHVSESSIGAIVASSGSAVVATKELIDAALKGGGSDNITAVVARFLVPEAGEP